VDNLLVLTQVIHRIHRVIYKPFVDNPVKSQFYPFNKIFAVSSAVILRHQQRYV
jgi:hypothetical protein